MSLFFSARRKRLLVLTAGWVWQGLAGVAGRALGRPGLALPWPVLGAEEQSLQVLSQQQRWIHGSSARAASISFLPPSGRQKPLAKAPASNPVPQAQLSWAFGKPQCYPKADVASGGFSWILGFFPQPGTQQECWAWGHDAGLSSCFQSKRPLLVSDLWISEMMSYKDAGHCVSLKTSAKSLYTFPGAWVSICHWRIHRELSICFSTYTFGAW